MARDDFNPDAPSAVGSELRDARESLGITIADMADALRIRAAHIEALEDGRFSDLPGRPYTLGFARSIARHLGLDADMIAVRLREEVTGVARPVELVFPESTEDKRLSRAGWIAISLVLVAAAYGAWLTLGPAGQEKPVEFATATPTPSASSDVIPREPGAAAPADTAIADKTPETAGAAPTPGSEPAPAAKPSATEDALQPTQSPTVTTPSPTSPSAKPRVASQPSLGAPEVSSPAAPPPATSAPASPSGTNAPQSAHGNEAGASPQPSAVAAVPSSAQPASRILLRARQDSWVQIQGASGATLMARTLRAGESYAVPEQAGLRLTTGNAGGLDVVVDGQAVPAFGQVGAVRRNIALDPARLKAGTALE
jgi:cytoskeleton protein RodZ